MGRRRAAASSTIRYSSFLSNTTSGEKVSIWAKPLQTLQEPPAAGLVPPLMRKDPVGDGVEPGQGGIAVRNLINSSPGHEEDVGDCIGNLGAGGATSAVRLDGLGVAAIDLDKSRFVVGHCGPRLGAGPHHRSLCPYLVPGNRIFSVTRSGKRALSTRSNRGVARRAPRSRDVEPVPTAKPTGRGGADRR